MRTNEEKLIYISHNNSDILELKTLLETDVNLNYQDSNGFTSLHYNSMKGYYEEIELLLENGADMDIKDNYGRKPFYYFYNEEERKFYEILYESYSNYNIKRTIKG